MIVINHRNASIVLSNGLALASGENEVDNKAWVEASKNSMTDVFIKEGYISLKSVKEIAEEKPYSEMSTREAEPFIKACDSCELLQAWQKEDERTTVQRLLKRRIKELEE